MDRYTYLTNPAMHQTSIPQCAIFHRNECAHMCPFLLLNLALWDMVLTHCGISEPGLSIHTWKRWNWCNYLPPPPSFCDVHGGLFGGWVASVAANDITHAKILTQLKITTIKITKLITNCLWPCYSQWLVLIPAWIIGPIKCELKSLHRE